MCVCYSSIYGETACGGSAIPKMRMWKPRMITAQSPSQNQDQKAADFGGLMGVPCGALISAWPTTPACAPAICLAP